VTVLSDAVVARLKSVASWPEFPTARYAAIEEIGRGGMGTVYLAIDEALGREVAIKIPNGVARAGLERRLQTEARVLARLEHPGIVPIHDTGRLADGRLFYVMKRVRGRTLREHLSELPDLPERLRIFERVCEPVAFAHAQGIIHRDLKPDNIMVGAFGEVMVMDWGVAKYLNDDAAAMEEPAGEVADRATHPGTVVGTRGFMPPEQARGDTGSIDRRADIYSLGAILFLLLTGEPPAPDADAGRAVWRHRSLPKPLRAICARALSAEPDGRYDSVAEVAADVARYRAGEAVLAYEENVLERLARVARAYRVAILLVLAYIVMRAAVALLAGW
jgi:eukaryotic-like serine/threonine-protein kinase